MNRDVSELRRIPAVDLLLQEPAVSALCSTYAHEVVVALIREELADTRSRYLGGEMSPDDLQAGPVADRIVQRASGLEPAPLVRVINATGILLHTNLGRAPLSAKAQQAVARIQGGYCSLEMDLGTGKRTSRLGRVRKLLCQVTGADDALAVNNNAAAVLLALQVLAAGREVIICRGEQVEIGGSFRLPDIIEASGAVMREVGTTNRTRIADYRDAVGPDTAMILKVHPSNYVVEGFTESVRTAELAELAREHEIILMEDLGSGALRQHPVSFLSHEPRVQDSLAAGVDLLSFSGDKLLGGPQAGIVLGREASVSRLRSHPLARVVRLDKLHLAALEATLTDYARGEAGLSNIPLYQLLLRSVAELREDAAQLAEQLRAGLDARWQIEVVDTESAVGGGSLPGETAASAGVSIAREGQSVDAVARALRSGHPAVVARIWQEKLLFDLRSLLEDDRQCLPGLLIDRLRPFEQED